LNSLLVAHRRAIPVNIVSGNEVNGKQLHLKLARRELPDKNQKLILERAI